jgi:hypothetical protein
MDTQQIHAAALAQGVTPQALDAVTAKVQAHFGDGTPRPADLDSFLAGLPVWDKIGMTEEAFMRYPPAWRLAQARNQLPPVQKQRPQPVTLSSEQAADLATLTPAQRLAAYRELQDQGKG